MEKESCAVLFSGGTDSTCVAALSAETFDQIHLLTFYERSTGRSPVPRTNFTRLKEKYGKEKFIHRLISTDLLVQKLSYENYFWWLSRAGLFVLATPGFSSLSWHLRTIKYCRDHGIKHVRDGMTKELLHLPGHMPEVRSIYSALYRSFGISFGSPIIDWDVPEDQRLADRLIVDRHGFSTSAKVQARGKTAGGWLFEKGIFPRPNVKGSLFDREMQHDCYPFVVYNMLVFWLIIPIYGWERFVEKTALFFNRKAKVAAEWLNAVGGESNQLFEPEETPCDD